MLAEVTIIITITITDIMVDAMAITEDIITVDRNITLTGYNLFALR